MQGVSYRHYTQKLAGSLGLKGYVKNKEEGSVEIIVDGDQKEIKKLIEWCGVGPALAKVEKVEIKKISDGDAKDLINEITEGFEIRY